MRLSERDMAASRRKKWLEITGLKRSKAHPRRLFKFFPPFWIPDGFDHTQMYYYPPLKEYVLMTESYNPIRRALETFNVMATGAGTLYAYKVSEKGLLNPPHCSSLMLSKPHMLSFLDEFEKALPELERKAKAII